MTYTEKQIERAKKSYNTMLQYRTVESYQPEFIGWNTAEQRCEYHNNIVREILNGNKGNKEKDYEQAQNEHKENFDIFEGLFEIENRDDINPKVGHTVDTFSIHNHIEKIQSSETPIFRIGGWYDGALGNSLLKSFTYKQITFINPTTANNYIWINLFCEC